VSISIVCNFTFLLLLLVTNSTWPEIYFGRFNPLDHASNMIIIDVTKWAWLRTGWQKEPKHTQQSMCSVSKMIILCTKKLKGDIR